MKTIVILTAKGGTGKSATAAAISHMLATVHNKKVLAIDADPQGTLTNYYSDINFVELFLAIINGNLEKDHKSIEDLLINPEMDVYEGIQKTAYENLDIIPSFLTLSEVEERLKADVRTPQQFRLKAHLDKIKEEYDYCIIDCSPSISVTNINALAAADEVYLPTRCDAGSCIGIAITWNLLNTVKHYNPKLVLKGCFFTQFNERKNSSKTVRELLLQLLPEEVLLPISIPVSKLIEESGLSQTPLLDLDKKAKEKVTQRYLDIVSYIIADDKRTFLNKWEKENQ